MSDDDGVALRQQLDLLLAAACRMGEIENYEDGIVQLRSAIRSGLVTPKGLFLMKTGHEPSTAADKALVGRLEAILQLISTREQLESPLNDFQSTSQAKMKSELESARTHLLPTIGEAFEAAGKRRPHRKGGGRPTTIPSNDVCRKVCKEIARLHMSGVSLVEAQKQVAAGSVRLFQVDKKLKLRTVQRIWAQRSEYLKDDLDGIK